MDKNIAARKYRQWICENSAELREFERKLQTAYNRQVLEAKLSYKKAEKLREKTIEKQIAEDERRKLLAEEERLKHEEEIKKNKEKALADTLQTQMVEKLKQQEYATAMSLMEQKLLYLELEEEKKREQEAAEKKRLDKERLRKEQMQFRELQLKIREEDRQHKLAEEARFREEATNLSKHDIAIIEARQQRIAAFEKIKERISSQLEELQRLKTEQEEIRQKMVCIEKEEQARKQAQQEEWNQVRKKQLSVQNYDELTKHKILEQQRLKEEDKIYAEKTRKSLQIAAELEREAEEEKRKQRATLRGENHNLIRYRRDLRTADLKFEIASAMAEEAARAERERVVGEERLRLLRSLDADLLKHLPRGSLTEQDYLNLNSPP